MTTSQLRNSVNRSPLRRGFLMKQIFLYTSLAVMALAVTTTGAAPEPCYGTVQLTSQSNFQVRQAGRQTFVQFDFTGLHDICLADRSVTWSSAFQPTVTLALPSTRSSAITAARSGIVARASSPGAIGRAT